MSVPEDVIVSYENLDFQMLEEVQYLMACWVLSPTALSLSQKFWLLWQFCVDFGP